MKPIPYGRQYISEEDIEAVISVLKSDFLTQGPYINKFEVEFAKYIGAKFAVSVSNGTAALHLSVLALDVKPGDKVITTPITFVATANCIRYAGGEVVFGDVNRDTYLLDIDSVIELLKKSPKGTYKGIILVDFGGRAVNLEEYKKLANEYNLWIIEDSCHSPGGYFVDSKNYIQNCGNGNFAELAIFSFHPVKHIASGEGGMITTNDEDLYKRLLKLRTHGITKNETSFSNSIEFAGGKDSYPNWYMEMQELGYNYRLTDFQAALGLSQLKRADVGISIRRSIAEVYNKSFSSIPQIIRHSGVIEGHAYHLYIIEVENRLELYDFLKNKSIFCQVHYIPVHKQPYYINLSNEIIELSNAEDYYSKCLSLPIFPTLKHEEIEFVIEQIKLFFSKD